MSHRPNFWTELFSALLLSVPVLAAPGLAVAQSPTPTTTIENGNGDTRLQLNYDGGLYVPGTYLEDGTENDSIPAEGAGTRLMWYSAKAAFRAGRVGVGPTKGDVWDADSVGSGSVAFGVDTKASGTDATAMGYRTTASGVTATAMGETTTASADHGTAMGSLTTASGEIATAMGSKTTAEGPVTLATGIETTASGFVATAMGNQTIASGYAATAMGRKTTAATDQSLSIGQCNSANQSEDATLLVIGNGTYSGGNVSGVCDDRSDALVLDESGNLTISGTLTENSDRRLKTQIEPLGSGTLQKLGELRPVRFEFRNQKTHPSGTQVGLIAQDVRKEFPALVSKGSGGYLSLAYPKMAAVLLKGIQEQQTTVEQQRARIESLKARVDRLERLRKRVAKLESRSGASLLAGLPGSGLLLGLLLGGLFSAALLWRRRN